MGTEAHFCRSSQNKSTRRYEQVLQQARTLKKNFKINPDKKKKFCAFMERILENGGAELHNLKDTRMFGLFHPKKDSIRVVFDSSAKL